VLDGLLQTDHHAEALDYLHALAGGSPATGGPVTAGVDDAYLSAFLSAKGAEAAEKGVALRVGEASWVDGRVVAPVEVTTVLGTLVDNALEAARLGPRRPAWVEVDLAGEGATLHVSVADSGTGVPVELAERIFTEGVSGRTGQGRGLGLGLARAAARAHGGTVWLGDPGGTDRGAVFVARLPGVLASGDPGSAGPHAPGPPTAPGGPGSPGPPPAAGPHAGPPTAVGTP
jgi:two-component system CitB family sensor kinase